MKWQLIICYRPAAQKCLPPVISGVSITVHHPVKYKFLCLTGFKGNDFASGWHNNNIIITGVRNKNE